MDRFAVFEAARKARLFLSVAAALLLAGILSAALTWQAGSPRCFTGVVRTVGVVPGSKYSGGSNTIASVQLDNGNIVTGYVDREMPVSPGESVSVWRYSRYIGGPIYEVVGH